ncbi:unnamed protein product [Durusdinium trenchii]|uniref:Uncharacterized protein n=1 Tax=Durusdinium trenchii TaxID=1381693 RepID=A0ABP0MYC0_9DINO
MGTQVTCNETDDDRDWAWVLELLELLGPKHVMALAVGNEMDRFCFFGEPECSSPRSCLDSSRRQELLQFKPPDVVPRACAQQIWSGGYFYRKLTERVKSLNELKGFQETDRQADRTRETGRWTSDVPAGKHVWDDLYSKCKVTVVVLGRLRYNLVDCHPGQDVLLTSVFGGYIIAGNPFVDTPMAKVLSFLQNVTDDYGDRWVFTLNVYPYFDPGNRLDPNSTSGCSSALETLGLDGDADGEETMEMGRKSLCFDGPGCLLPSITSTMRRSMEKLTGTKSGANAQMAKCKNFSSELAFRTYYQNFLKWNLSIGTDERGPDHVFYFTLRDSVNFGVGEHFGLIESCDSESCKLEDDHDFSEILSHWDQVLQSLDRLSTYTAERAGDGKAACCRTERPLLLGQTPEGSEWQALRKPGGYPCRPAGVSLEARELQVSASLPEERSQGTSRDHDAPVPRSVGFPDGPLPQRALGERPRVLVERLAREEACGVLQLIVNAWREERWKQGLRAKAVLMQNALKSEREKLRRRVALADQVQLKEALRLSFHAWHLEGRHSKALKALPSHVPDRGVTSTALPSSESQVDHDGLGR